VAELPVPAAPAADESVLLDVSERVEPVLPLCWLEAVSVLPYVSARVEPVLEAVPVLEALL
jgi:hypothetical protein